MAQGGSRSVHTLVLDHVSPATRLLEKRRQMFEVQAALDAQKEEFARREEAFRRREEGLRKKDLDLQEALIKLNKFLQESDTKRNRALKRADDESRAKQKKQKLIESMKESMEALKQEKIMVAAEEKAKDKYRQYLLSVQNYVDDDYHDVTQLLDRYQTLNLACQDIMKAQQRAEAEVEEQRRRLNILKKERTNRLFESNTRKAELQKTLEKVSEEVAELQGRVDAAVESAKGKASELGKVLMAVSNLLKRCTAGRSFPKHTETERAPEAYGDEIQVVEEEAKPEARTIQWSGKGAGLGKRTDLEPKQKGKTKAASQEEDAKKLEERTRKAMLNLRIIADYMKDFEDIVNEAKKDKEAGKIAPVAPPAMTSPPRQFGKEAGRTREVGGGGGGGSGGGLASESSSRTLGGVISNPTHGFAGSSTTSNAGRGVAHSSSRTRAA